MSKITLGLHTPNPKDATSFYRAYGPWSAVKNQIDILPIEIGPMDWSKTCFIDVLFLHRPFSPAHLDMILSAKRQDIPVWVDFDDDLFNVHLSNSNHDLYDRPQTKDTLTKILSLSDLVTVSTQHLKLIYEPHLSSLSKIEVIPNALPSNIIGDIIHREVKTAPKKIVLWRGTPHHEMNLHFYQDCFIELMRNNTDWHFMFYGYRPWYIIEKGNPGQSAHSAAPNILEYFNDLQGMQAAIQVVPLVDHQFNRSKSNIAYLEGSGIGGSVCVVPDMQEWKDLNYCSQYKANDKKSFVESVQRVIDMKFDARWKLAEKARSEVLSKFVLRPSLRIDLLRELLPSFD